MSLRITRATYVPVHTSVRPPTRVSSTALPAWMAPTPAADSAPYIAKPAAGTATHTSSASWRVYPKPS